MKSFSGLRVSFWCEDPESVRFLNEQKKIGINLSVVMRRAVDLLVKETAKEVSSNVDTNHAKSK